MMFNVAKRQLLAGLRHVALSLALIFAVSGVAHAQTVLVGSYSYTYSPTTTAGTVAFTVAQVHSNWTTRTTGTLRLELWATTTPYTGGALSGYKLATYQLSGSSNGTLAPGASFTNISGTATVTSNPPAGSYYVTLVVGEFTSTCTASDQFCIATYGSFPNQLIKGTAGSQTGPSLVDDFAASTSTTGTVAVGGTQSGSIETGSDVDWFRVSLTAGTSYRIDLRGSASSGGTLSDPFLALRNSSGTLLVDDDDSGTGLDSQLTYTPTASGTYYIAASAFSTSTGTYTVAVTNTSGVSTSSLRSGAIFSTAQSGSQSFLRFYNSGATAGTVTATLYDNVTGLSRGQWTSPSIPAGAELQYDIATVETGAGVTGTRPSYYALSLQSGFAGYFQHVLFRPTDGTLTNLSTCAAGVTADPTKLSGVHSTIIGAYGFPSTIVVTNTGTAAAAAALGIYDARDGTKLGTYTTAAISANGEAVLSIASIEAGINLNPSAGMGHYVVKFDSTYTGYLQHLVTNVGKGVVTDMTTACALSGTASATAASPLRSGAIFSTAQSSSQSFLRFYNSGATAGTVTATLYDNVTGLSRGQWTSPSIPAGAELQYDIATVETGAGVTGTRPSYYALSLQSGFAGYFQHVLFRPTDGTLTNLSTCTAGVTADAAKLSGVHSTIVGAYGFPSTIVVTNTGAAAATAALGIYDARNGTKLGTYTTASIAANGEAVLSVASIEAGINLIPSAGMGHYVIKTEGTFTGYLQHLVTNVVAGVVTDMTTACALAASTSGGSTTFYALATSTAGTGSGTITLEPSGQISDLGANFPAGAGVTLTAAASATSTFAGWSGACSGTALTCQVTMNASKSVVATFNLRSGASSCPAPGTTGLTTVVAYGAGTSSSGTVSLVFNALNPTSGMASICSNETGQVTGNLTFNFNLTTNLFTLTGTGISCSIDVSSPTAAYSGQCGALTAGSSSGAAASGTETWVGTLTGTALMGCTLFEDQDGAYNESVSITLLVPPAEGFITRTSTYGSQAVNGAITGSFSTGETLRSAASPSAIGYFAGCTQGSTNTGAQALSSVGINGFLREIYVYSRSAFIPINNGRPGHPYSDEINTLSLHISANTATQVTGTWSGVSGLAGGTFVFNKQ